MSLMFTLILLCLPFFGFGDEFDFHCEELLIFQYATCRPMPHHTYSYFHVALVSTLSQNVCANVGSHFIQSRDVE
jgi:hypothetical protein